MQTLTKDRQIQKTPRPEENTPSQLVAWIRADRLPLTPGSYVPSITEKDTPQNNVKLD